MSKITFVAKTHLDLSVSMPFGGVTLTLAEAEKAHASLGTEIARMRAMARNAEAEKSGVKFTQDGTQTAEESLRA